MKRVLVFMEGWGCRKKGKREYCRFVVNDIVTVTLWRNYSRGNRIVPTDDDKASAIGVLVEYLGGDYDWGIAIVRDGQASNLFKHFIKELHEGKDICWFIWNEKVRKTCYAVASTPDEYRRARMKHFKIIQTERFSMNREEMLKILRDAMDNIAGVDLTIEELELLIRHARS